MMVDGARGVHAVREDSRCGEREAVVCHCRVLGSESGTSFESLETEKRHQHFKKRTIMIHIIIILYVQVQHMGN